MTDHLDLEAIKERVAQLWPTAEYVDDGIADAAADCRALISEVERLRADVERKDEALRYARMHTAGLVKDRIASALSPRTPEQED